MHVGCRRCRAGGDGGRQPRVFSVTAALAAEAQEILDEAAQLAMFSGSDDDSDHFQRVARCSVRARVFSKDCRQGLAPSNLWRDMELPSREALPKSLKDACTKAITAVQQALTAHGIALENCYHLRQLRDASFDPHQRTPSEMLHLYWLGLVKELTDKLVGLLNDHSAELITVFNEAWSSLPWHLLPFSFTPDRVLRHWKSMHGSDFKNLLTVRRMSPFMHACMRACGMHTPPQYLCGFASSSSSSCFLMYSCCPYLGCPYDPLPFGGARTAPKSIWSMAPVERGVFALPSRLCLLVCTGDLAVLLRGAESAYQEEGQENH